MRSRDEVLRAFPNAQRVLTGERTVWRDRLAPEIERMADRIRELEAQVVSDPHTLAIWAPLSWLHVAAPSAAGVQVTEAMEEAFMAAYAECEFENGGNFTHRMGINAGITAALTAASEVQP